MTIQFCICRDHVALNVYVALCYHRLEYFDVSQEVLAVYLQAYQGSAIALNLRACNTFRLYNGAAAEKELKPLINIMVCSLYYEFTVMIAMLKIPFSNHIIIHDRISMNKQSITYIQMPMT